MQEISKFCQILGIRWRRVMACVGGVSNAFSSNKSLPRLLSSGIGTAVNLMSTSVTFTPTEADRTSTASGDKVSLYVGVKVSLTFMHGVFLASAEHAGREIGTVVYTDVVLSCEGCT